MSLSDYMVFVDESGDHSLDSIDAEYPIFVLAFCIIRKDRYVDEIIPAIKRAKIETFGHDLAILHERDMRRKTGWFSKLAKEPREAFMETITQIMRDADFHIIAIIIDKNRLKQRYSNPDHPYHLALTFGLERLSGFLRAHETSEKVVHVICESRGAKEDKDLELAFRRVCDGENYSGEKYPHEIVMADKKCNSTGLQIADLIARPVGLSYLKPDQPNRAYDILSPKFCTNGYGHAGGVGRKIFP